MAARPPAPEKGAQGVTAEGAPLAGQDLVL